MSEQELFEAYISTIGQQLYEKHCKEEWEAMTPNERIELEKYCQEVDKAITEEIEEEKVLNPYLNS